MQKLNLSKNEIAAFDIDAQQTFTPLCPDELPVAGGDMIAEELNAQAAFASVRVAPTPYGLPKTGTHRWRRLQVTKTAIYTGPAMP